MPAIRACVWNIQNYGSGEQTFKWGDDSDLRNRFIACFVEAHGIDVLLIQEVSPNAESSLGDLISSLEAYTSERHWAVSFCGSAIRKHASDPPLDETEVSFRSDARHEGYAVAWRTRSASFRLVDSVTDISVRTIRPAADPRPVHPLNLSTDGRPAHVVRGEDWTPLGGYRAVNVYPYDEHGRVMRTWPKLMLPTTSVRNPNTLAWEGSRRPAYVLIELLDGPREPGRRLVPLSAYHAPSNEGQAEWGARTTSLARELYVAHPLRPDSRVDPARFVSTTKNVIAGDYNFSVDAGDWPHAYRGYLEPLSAGPDGGAACLAAPAPPLTDEQRRSIVRLKFGGRPVTGRRVTDYLAYKIDLAFFPRSATAERVSVPDEMIRTPLPYRRMLRALQVHLDRQIRAFGADKRLAADDTGPEVLVDRRRDVWSPMISANYKLDGTETFRSWRTFVAQLRGGALTDARQACEFYAFFVSDHLPLVIDINYTRA
jgi:hypothetical protein